MTDARVPPPNRRSRLAVGLDLANPEGRTRGALVKAFLWQVLVTALALGIAAEVLGDVTATAPGALVFAAVMIGLVGAVLGPLFQRFAVALGWLGVAFLALLSQAIVVYVAISISPGIEVTDFWGAFFTSWVVAIVGLVVGYVTGTDDETAFVAEVLRRAMRKRDPDAELEDPDQPGVVFVQMDGVSQPLLEWALLAGNLPTLGRWMRDGSHVSTGWTCRIPSTTPISQAGILHGCTDDMPAFRWYEKTEGKLVVANHPPDAALIEDRLSDGRGLLADDGVSVSNLFSGDAQLSLLTMSALGRSRSPGRARDFMSFFATPYGFGRALFRTIGEMLKEMYQSRRAISRGVEPRVPRHGAYIALRGFTNVMQRDLNVVLVAEAMMRGSKSVYVDFLDYDEIAHHAGLGRPESLAAVQGIDRAIGTLEAVARYAPRNYEFVVLSDHGQSQGATFLQRFDEPLEDLVRRLMGGAQDVVAATGKDEDWGPLNAFLSSLRKDTVVRLGPSSDAQDDLEVETELVVAGSGNLGLVWFPQQPGRVTLEQAEVLWPGLVTSLATHPGVSFVVVDTATDGPVVLGSDGVHRLVSGEVDGTDPLAPFDDHVASDLLRIARFHNAADIYVNSSFDPETGEVAAFEELVGCHGGTGGWQTKAMLVHPVGWTIDDDLLEPRARDDHESAGGHLLGAEQVHVQLVRWLERIGHRAGLADRVSARD